MPFDNREQAAEQLAGRLGGYRGDDPLVLAVPRGALPMGKIIAERLEGELDVVLVHKLGAPYNPEYAIGAVDETGEVFLSESAQHLGFSENYIKEETQRQLDNLQKRRRSYTPVRAPIDPAGRTVIVVDDGVATGATLTAALRAVRQKGPAKLIAAVAVAPPDAKRRLAEAADEVIVLETPAEFFAVGQFFRDFGQVTDQQAVEILREADASRQGGDPST